MVASPQPRIHPGLDWLEALGRPEACLAWSLGEWSRVIRQARSLRLLARLAEALEDPGIEGALPSQPRNHLVAERRRSRARLRALTWTIDNVGRALAPLNAPKLLLKGAAYVAQDLPIARGRLPSDLDILVPKAHLDEAQRLLAGHDWQEVELDAHDQRYYRDWSHEAPAMHNPHFELELDLHHGILPPVASTTVDPDLLLSRCVPSGRTGWHVLSPVDQVLHSAAHLFLDSELRGRIRDLVDLRGLMECFGRHPSFWDELEVRSNELGLASQLALGLHYAHRWVGASVPEPLLARSRRAQLTPVTQAWLLPLLDAVMLPPDPDADEPLSRRMAARLLLMRYHWNRLPLRLLVPHLLHKSAKRPPRSPFMDGADDN